MVLTPYQNASSAYMAETMCMPLKHRPCHAASLGTSGLLKRDPCSLHADLVQDARRAEP